MLMSSRSFGTVPKLMALPWLLINLLGIAGLYICLGMKCAVWFEFPRSTGSIMARLHLPQRVPIISL